MKAVQCLDCPELVKSRGSERCRICANRWIAKNRKANAPTGPRSGKWKGGIMISKEDATHRSYAYLLMPEHPRARRRYVKRADVVLEGKLGRALRPEEIAHHKDHDTLNDSPENLEAMNRIDHIRMHQREAVIARWKPKPLSAVKQ